MVSETSLSQIEIKYSNEVDANYLPRGRGSNRYPSFLIIFNKNKIQKFKATVVLQDYFIEIHTWKKTFSIYWSDLRTVEPNMTS